ncbi:MAG: pyridoxamine 5'-phosphate oxidase family protein [Proteobacteria bacterium]|nr:pyridoxamine 5'-phosphate oxidase family protein [Pseudomonadota bacterium]
MDADTTTELRALLQDQPIAALGTLHEVRGTIEPFVSMVPVAWGPDGQPLIHVSGLAPHTRDLQAHPQVSLMFTAPLAPAANPQALARVTLQARAVVIARDDADWPAARAVYQGRFPRSEQTFALGDFLLVRLQPQSARFVAGFGRAFGLTAAALAALLKDLPAPQAGV